MLADVSFETECNERYLCHVAEAVASAQYPRKGLSGRVAFFDVDHTIITGSSLAGFFAQLTQDNPDAELVSAVAELQERAATEEHTALITHAMRLLRGQSWDDMHAVGQTWYDQHGAGLFVEAIRDRLRWHQGRGDTIVLVSGSWLPSLTPIARALGVDHILCCTPDVDAGYLTGEMPYVVMGEGKVRAISEFAREYPINFDEAFAYGDDPADIPMLELVSHPVAVGPNAVLVDVARTRGWEHLNV
jgi:HAD superfamily hydrolase (TIGR01490 family)